MLDLGCIGICQEIQTGATPPIGDEEYRFVIRKATGQYFATIVLEIGAGSPVNLPAGHIPVGEWRMQILNSNYDIQSVSGEIILALKIQLPDAVNQNCC